MYATALARIPQPLVDCVARGRAFERGRLASGMRGLGQPLICGTTVNCSWGASQVAALRRFFEEAVARSPAKAAPFETAVASLELALADAVEPFSKWQPWTWQACCAVGDIGEQANAMRDRIAAATGFAAPPRVAGGFNWLALLGLGASLAFLVLLLLTRFL